MSESKHTPGPWRVARHGYESPLLTHAMVEADNGASICGIWWPDAPREVREEQAANAALIARASELLAENEELMEAHQALGHEYEMLARERDKLQADLDAALLVCETLGVQYGRMWLSVQAREAGQRVQQLLTEREVKRG